VVLQLASFVQGPEWQRTANLNEEEALDLEEHLQSTAKATPHREPRATATAKKNGARVPEIVEEAMIGGTIGTGAKHVGATELQTGGGTVPRAAVAVRRDGGRTRAATKGGGGAAAAAVVGVGHRGRVPKSGGVAGAERSRSGAKRRRLRPTRKKREPLSCRNSS